MTTTLPRVWITKYALTTGVFTADNVEVSHEEKMVSFRQEAWPRIVHFHKPDWWPSESGAIARVKVMIAAREASLAKEQAKLNALKEKLSGDSLDVRPWGQAPQVTTSSGSGEGSA